MSAPLPGGALLSPEALASALALRDLSDPAQGPHAMQLVVDAALSALRGAWGCPVRLERAHPVVSVEDKSSAGLIVESRASLHAGDRFVAAP